MNLGRVLRRFLLQRRVNLALLFKRDALALQRLADMLSLDADDHSSRFAYAALAARLGHHQAAEQALQTLLQAQPDHAAAHFNLGFLLEQTGVVDRAERHLRRAVELDDTIDRAWYGLGLLLLRSHRMDEAIQALRRCTELQPMSPYAWYQLGMAHAQQGEDAEARRIVEHLRTFEPRFAATLERDLPQVHTRQATLISPHPEPAAA